MADLRIGCVLRRLLRDQAGASVIELALILPVLVMLACGASDLALGYARKLALQQAAARTMEFAYVAGNNNANLSTTLATEAAAAANVPTNQVTVDLWLECAGVRQSTYTGSCTGSSPARFVSVTITDSYTWLFQRLWGNDPNDTASPISGYAMVRLS